MDAHHPDVPEAQHKIDLAIVTGEPELQESDRKNIVVFGEGQYDRRPCGTGTAARLSVLYKKGLVEIGEPYTHESIINTILRVRILRTTKVGRYDAVVPEITGRAFITQIAQILITPDNPLKNGFSVRRYCRC